MDTQLWVDESDRFDRMLAPYGDALLRELAVQPGESVLDVGCGGGTSTIAIADAVGPSGRVVGIDIDELLLALARERTAACTNVELLTGDAASFAYEPASFDAITSRMGMMLFDDPPAAFTNLALALRSGGRLVFATWAERAANAWRTVPESAVAAHVPMPESAPTAPGPFALASPARIHELCAKAGLHDIRTMRVETRVRMGRDVTDAVEFFERSAGNLRTMLPADVADRVAATLRVSLVPYAEGDGVRLPAAAWIVSASAL